ncbi:ABC transporter ATP-binding protein [Halostella sp. JP-L12]|uniref:ABC transporter ATP-binding protein n=1 Tax=Halostella TaxID=1843185 RepID=UPI000EF785B4|nr:MULTISPECIES: ABC transporter ATP-binding protein [Halostella]NHN46437.1 ABC transporter ATP-binding protein [Halostella sp. JP-L12]
MVTNPILACRSLTREYTRGGRGLLDRFRSREYPTVRALDGVSLDVAAGDVVGLAGPSGSGKSTLLHLLAGLDAPTRGSIQIGGTDVSELSSRGRTRLRRDRVGIVFQRFYLLPSLSARGNVALPLVEQGTSKRRRRERATSLLEAVGLGDRIDHSPDELSGGEQQRVAIARALASDPDVVLADEPTGELDSETGDRVLDVLTDVADDRAVVLASHDERTLARTDRVVRLRDGRRVDDG